MTTRSFIYDARLPVSPTTSESDPTHPKNLMRKALIIQNQAVADTKYDIIPPPRVEGFAGLARSAGSGAFLRSIEDKWLRMLIGILIIGFILIFITTNRYVRGAMAIGLIFVIHQIVKRLEGGPAATVSL